MSNALAAVGLGTAPLVATMVAGVGELVATMAGVGESPPQIGQSQGAHPEDP